MTENYTIEARSYHLLGFASHNFWVLRDSEERALSQLHGLATDRISNCFKPIGYFQDRLGFYEFKTSENGPSFISTTQQLRTVYQGCKEDVFVRWQKASAQVDYLNSLDINYSPFGILGFPVTNSNSAFHLFAWLMGIECCRFSGVLEPGINNSLQFCFPRINNAK